MKIKKFISCFLLGVNLILAIPLQASRVNLFRTSEDAEIYLTQHYNRACQYYNQKQWQKAVHGFESVICLFPNSEAAAKAYFFLGVSFFQLGEYDFANHAFSNYIKAQGQPEFFEEAVNYKFCIAEYFKAGHRRRLFKMRYCPKWASARTMALKIYDEVIVALPNHELAACSLYEKGILLQQMGKYREAVEAFQTLIRRFSKYELSPQAYLQIAQCYCIQSSYELQNPDLLALAEINVRKFKADFPRDERIEMAEGYVARIKENFASGLSDIGSFYERVCKPDAASIYYQSAIEEFPDTQVAEFCRHRLLQLGYDCEEDEIAPDCAESLLGEQEAEDEVAS